MAHDNYLTLAQEPEGKLRWATRTIEQKGIVLPWKRVEHHGPQEINGRRFFEDRPPKGTVLERGTVFIPETTLYELAEQGTYDSQFGSAFLLGVHEGYALAEAGLAVQETKGGYHGTDKLRRLLKMREEGL